MTLATAGLAALFPFLLKRGRRLALVLALAAAPLFSSSACAAELSAEDRATVAAVEAALNEIRSLKSRFLQISSNGGMAGGTLYLKRPGRLRIEYDPGVPVMLIANNGWLIEIDTKLATATHIPLSRTPANILVAERIRLSGDVIVTSVTRQRGVVRIGLVRKGSEDEGRLALVFQDPPLELRQWVVTDAQGIETRVSLLDPEKGVNLDEKLFEYNEQGLDRMTFE
jgi:outer membrane lipoprotein-sorting protein